VIDPGFGIETATLTASWVEALPERQTVGRHLRADGTHVDVSQLVDTLGVRLGSNNVFRLAPVENALPERAMRRVVALEPAEGLDWPKNLPRPARLLEIQHYGFGVITSGACLGVDGKGKAPHWRLTEVGYMADP
jgi:protein ImuB